MRLAARLFGWRLLRQRRAAVASTFALMSVPLVSSVALAVDYSLVADARLALQHAVDEAAIAGASAYTDSSQASNAQTVATNAFNAARLPGTLTKGTPTVTTNANGTINPNLGTQSAYSVSVTDTATLDAGFIRIFRPSLSITARATAANPKIAPKITVSNVRANACDGNAVYLYVVPNDSHGKPDYTHPPSFTTGSSGNYYEIGNNFGGALPSGQALPTVTANQPLGIMLTNKKNGNCGGISSADSYGNPNGYTVNFYSGFLGAGLSPSEQAASQSTYTLTTTCPGNGACTGGFGAGNSNYTYTANWGSGNVSESAPGNPSCNTGTSTYSWRSNTTTTVQTCKSTEPNSTSTDPVGSHNNTPLSATPNCSLYVQTGVTQSTIDNLSNSSSPPNAVPSGQQGSCYSPTDVSSGYKYAVPTCSQLSSLSAQTAVFWWNDTGGNANPNYEWGTDSPGDSDDRDYNDAFFALTCTAGNGGSGTGLTSVVLTQ